MSLAWIAADARNAEVLFPYLNGEDLNSRPDASASRWVIDFNDRTESEASKYELPFKRVLESIKPERIKNNRKVYRAYWWQYAEKRPAMRRAMVELPEVLVIARVSKTVMPLRVPTEQVFNEKTVVFATTSYSMQAALSSTVHQLWAIKFGTTLRNDPQYTPSDVFDTFPSPEPTTALNEIGSALDAKRHEIMLRRGLGLTKLYNLVNDTEISDAADRDVACMRALHEDLDRCVLDAYGWSDIHADHGFHTFRKVQRWSVSPAARIEILDRLLEENHRRARAETSNS